MQEPKQRNSLYRYSGLAMQFLVSLGIAVLLGLKADRWLNLSLPVFVWLLPLLVLVGLMINIIKETSKRK